MTAEYIKEPGAAVHVADPRAGNEFTYCGKGWVTADSGGFFGVVDKGPATCWACHGEIARIRNSIMNVRWKR